MLRIDRISYFTYLAMIIRVGIRLIKRPMIRNLIQAGVEDRISDHTSLICYLFLIRYAIKCKQNILF